jgi:hypothetical protein
MGTTSRSGLARVNGDAKPSAWPGAMLTALREHGGRSQLRGFRVIREGPAWSRKAVTMAPSTPWIASTTPKTRTPQELHNGTTIKPRVHSLQLSNDL